MDLENPFTGSISYVVSMLDFSAIFIVMGIIWLRPPWHKNISGNNQSTNLKLVSLAVMLSLLLLYMLVLFTGATAFKSRWMMPILVLIPILVLARCPDICVEGRRLKGLLVSITLVAVLITLGIAGRYWAAPLTGAYTRPHFPGHAMALEVEKLVGTPARIIAENNRILAALKLHFPGTEVAYSESISGTTLSGPLLLVWDDEGGSKPPAAIDALIKDWRNKQFPYKEYLLHLPLRLGNKPIRKIYLREYQLHAPPVN